MTTITFERSGGAIGHEIDFDVDLNDLPANEAQYLNQLLLDSDFFNIPEDLTGNITPDEFRYTITVKAGNSSHTVHASDTTMPKSLVPMVKELTTLKMTQ